jgi:hypothetical protein
MLFILKVLLSSLFSVRVNCEKSMPCNYFTLVLFMFILKMQLYQNCSFRKGKKRNQIYEFLLNHLNPSCYYTYHQV